MNWSISFEPLFALNILGIILVPITLLVLTSLFLHRRGALLRLAALIAIVLALLNPVLLDEQRDPLKSVVAVVVDRSQSQDIGNRTKATEDAAAARSARLERMNQCEVRMVEAGRSDASEERTETRLFEALDGALRDVPPSRIGGAIMITDGQVHDVPETASGLSAPLHALITGEENEKDRRIRFERAPRFAIVDQPLEMTFRVLSATGETGPVEVEIFVNGELQAIDEAEIGREMSIEVEIPIAGRNVVELRIPVEEGELTDTNNRAIALVDGIRENLRVLLVSGEPHSGERTWRNLLKSDASVDLVHFTILRPPEKQDGTPINELSLIAFPTRELFVEKVNDFDLIIFDRYQHRDVLPLLYYDYIAEYVQNGGALLIAAGPEFASGDSIARTPLISALPAIPNGEVVEAGFLPRLSDVGKRHPVTRGLDGSNIEPPHWSRWFRIIGIGQPEGHVVMQGADERPLLLLSRVGEGRVGMFLSGQGWLWARGFEGGGPYVSLYRRIAHWLMKEPELEEERLTAAGRGMTLEVTRQSLADQPEPVTVTTPSGTERELPLVAGAPGLFDATMTMDEVGLYQVRSGDLTALAHVGPVNAPEFADTVSTEEVLRPVAEDTRGSARRIAGNATGVTIPNIVPVRSNASTAAGRDWIGLQTTNDSVLRSVHRVPLFSGFLGLGVLLLAFGAMWYREGR